MERWGLAFRLLGVGFYIGICIVGGITGGLWLDGKLNTRPIFVIAGLILGLVFAAYGVYRMILPLANDKRTRGK
jgi:hypothetical protein